ncbi:unnamed protein product [Discula destructiva]
MWRLCLRRKRTLLSGKQSGTGGIMSAFARALEVHEREVVADHAMRESKDDKKGLSIEEISGNLFIVNFAGLDNRAMWWLEQASLDDG